MADDWLGISSANYDSHCGDYSIDYNLLKGLDGDSFWSHQVNETHWFIIDLGQTYTIKKVRGRSNWVDDPISVNIYVSDDKENWGAAVATGADYQDTDEWVETDTTDKDGRYIKVEIITTEDGLHYLTWGLYSPSAPMFDAYGDVAVGGEDLTLELSETLSLSESLKHDIGVKISETLGLSEDIATQSEFYVALSETLALSESIASDIAVYLSDTLDLSEDLTAEITEAIVKILRKRYIAGLKPARIAKVGRIGL